VTASTTTTTTTTTGRTARAPRARQSAPGSDAVDAEIDERCAELRLPTVRDRFSDIAQDALRDRANYKGFLLELLRAECAERDERRKARLVREANFHRPKRLDTFEYDKNPNVDPVYVNNLTNPGWVNAGAPLCLLGSSGTGKSHLLIGIGTAIA
jgi:DNA replication protein DnaC